MGNDEKVSNIVRYQELLQDIRYTKQQQWQTVFYGVSLQGAVIWYLDKIDKTNCSFKYLFIIVVPVLVWYCGLKLLDAYYEDITRYRTEKDTIIGKTDGIYKSDKIFIWTFRSVLTTSALCVVFYALLILK
ncbi:MAG: hypothetical protein WA118_08240 [Carboxydocellales bacterium]